MTTAINPETRLLIDGKLHVVHSPEEFRVLGDLSALVAETAQVRFPRRARSTENRWSDHRWRSDCGCGPSCAPCKPPRKHLKNT